MMILRFGHLDIKKVKNLNLQNQYQVIYRVSQKTRNDFDLE